MEVLYRSVDHNKGAKMKRHILFILLVLSTYLLSGTSWIRSYPWLDVCPYQYDSAQARAYNVIPAIGGGYLLQGHVGFYNTDSYVMEKNVFWKIEDNGDMIWRRLGYDSDPYNVVVSNGVDRYYCIATFELYTAMDVFDSQINLLGHYQFNQVNGFNANLSDAVLTSDGLVFAAKVGGNAVILKTDFEFNLIWQGPEVYALSNGFWSVVSYNGGCLAVSDTIVAQYSATGDTLWTYQTTDIPVGFRDCVVTSDNQVYAIGQRSYLSAAHIFLYDIDPLNQIVETISGGLNYGSSSQARKSVIEASNGNLIILCHLVNSDVLHAFSPAGEHLWSRNFSPYQFYYLGQGTNNLLLTPDDGILFCAYNQGQVLLVKTDINGNVVANDDPIHTPPVLSTSYYPNPARTHLTIDYKTDGREVDLNLEIFNLRGQMVFSSLLESKEGTIRIDILNNPVYNFSPGIYMYQIKDRYHNICASKRFIVIK